MPKEHLITVTTLNDTVNLLWDFINQESLMNEGWYITKRNEVAVMLLDCSKEMLLQLQNLTEATIYESDYVLWLTTLMDLMKYDGDLALSGAYV